MGAAIGLRDDFDAAGLRRLARTTKSANQSRPLLAFAEIYDGRSRSDAARIGGVTLQIVRDWAVRFNARGPEGLLDGKAPGKPPLLNDVQRQALAEIIESGPIPAIHGVVRWRLIDLARWLHDEFGVSLTETTVGREMKKLGYVQTDGTAASSRPERICDGGLQKGGFAAELAKVKAALPHGTPIEVWFQVASSVFARPRPMEASGARQG